MQLYFTPRTISIAVLIALEEAGLAYDALPIDFAKAEQTKPEFLKVNPKGRVPAVVTPEATLTEAGALLELVADLAPNAGLRPTDPIAIAKMREVMFYLASTMHVNHAHKLRGHRWADQESSHRDMTAKVPETMAQSCAYISDHALLGPYVLGDVFSLADIYLYVVCTWLQGDGVNLDDFPTIQSFMTTMEARETVQAAKARGML
ncbi:glutathione S-transferase [Epibacterium sp. SM1979]|uniref:Glutathione S-transferase n=1 Tax=Tritonibacter litoralis TaxID=2662264 RepID=A0A843YFL4_9RHOB|nr:glutathione S-transferase family protein [Tritonibacter litoralis]MQQ08072.1 glutathione S-transferase [Tritonibacter litoralis]